MMDAALPDAPEPVPEDSASEEAEKGVDATSVDSGDAQVCPTAACICRVQRWLSQGRSLQLQACTLPFDCPQVGKLFLCACLPERLCSCRQRC